MNKKGRVETVVVWIALAILVFVILAFIFKSTVFGAKDSVDQMISCQARGGDCENEKCDTETQMQIPAKCLHPKTEKSVCCADKTTLFGEKQE